ncbi:MAG TPA: CpcT/CpeT family chromophore lyase [Steroidobacteraceae bacterium]|nr:CpcT/CpeT family chromophore lyase [Steroidobacteraceae bacterium]
MPDNACAMAMRAAALLAVLVLAGCSTEATKRQLEFDKLLQKLPGQYDNLAQAHSDASGEHAAVALLIRPVNALTVGKLVMFVRETAADDPRRVLAQHIWTFDMDKKNQLVQTIYLFKEPQRWVHAVDDPYIMQSVLPNDLSVLSGCNLIWTKSDSGFKATTKAQECKASAGAEGLLIEQSAELRGSDLLLNEQLSGPGGSLEGSADAASSYRFQRRSGPSQKQ